MDGLSGIVGLFLRNGLNAASDRLTSMADAISERGSIGPETVFAGEAGLGQILLPTTPEDHHEELPRAAGPITIAMDGRIDNREHLIAELDLTGGPVTDSELLLAAYQTWGTDCPKYIVGAFAFAIHDTESQRLFCARDHMGIRPLMFYRSDDFVAIASEAKALFELEEIKPVPDEFRVGEYLIGLRSDPARSFFDSLEHLPAGHVLVVDRKEIRTRRYWSLDNVSRIELASDSAYASQFLAHFEQAVRCRIRTQEPISATLSGGIDSSAICCVACDLLEERDRTPLSTLSVKFPEVPESDEREFVSDVLDFGDFDPTWIRGDRTGPLTNLSERLTSREEPFDPEIFAFHDELFEEAAQINCTVLLDGFGGDQTVSYGWGLLRELALRGHWLQLYREAGNFAEVWQPNRHQILYTHVLKPLIPEPFRRIYLLVRRQEPLSDLNPAIDTEFGQRIGLPQQVRRLKGQGQPKTHADLHRKTLSNPRLTASLEGMNKIAVRHGFQPRYPFLDRRLLEFCVALPVEQVVRQGRHRHVLREALDGRVPESVRTRLSKAEFTSTFVHGLSEFDRPRLEQGLLEDGDSLVGPYLDMEVLYEAFERFETEPTTEDARTLSKPAVLYAWSKVYEDWLHNKSEAEI